MSSVSRKLGKFLEVKNFMNKNQFELTFEHGFMLQSYSSIVAVKVYGMPWIFGAHHDYSATTNRHMKEFCGYTAQERRDMIESDEAYIIA